jgi:addiction module HigA family antidote
MKRRTVPEPIHPGEILREELLVPLGISVHSLAQRLRVPPTRMHEIVHGGRAVTADTAIRLQNVAPILDRGAPARSPRTAARGDSES